MCCFSSYHLSCTLCFFFKSKATGNTLLFFAAAISNVIFSILISLLSGWQLGLAILPLMPLTVMAGIVQGYMNSTYEMKSHIRTEASGRVAHRLQFLVLRIIIVY